MNSTSLGCPSRTVTSVTKRPVLAQYKAELQAEPPSGSGEGYWPWAEGRGEAGEQGWGSLPVRDGTP